MNAFDKVVLEIGQDFKTDLYWEPEALEAIQLAAEQYVPFFLASWVSHFFFFVCVSYIVELFELACLHMVQRGSDVLQPQDLNLVRRTIGERF